CAFDVARPDARAEAEPCRICELDRLVLGVERLHGDDGPEDLLLLDACLGITADQYRRLVEPAGQPDPGTPRAGDRLGSLFERLSDQILDARTLPLGDERTEIGVGIVAPADPQLTRARGQRVDEARVQIARDVDPLDADADLTAVHEGAVRRAVDRTVEVGV